MLTSEILRFLLRPFGKKITAIGVVNIFLGLGLFFIDLIIATELQAFLIVFNIVPLDQNFIFPAWLVRSQFGVAWTLAVAVCFRAALQWLHNYYKDAIAEQFRFYQRVQITNSIGRGSNISIGKTIGELDSWVMLSGEMLIHLQILLQTVCTGIAFIIVLLKSSPRLFVTAHFLIVLFLPVIYLLNKIIHRNGRSFSLEWMRFVDHLTFCLRNVLLLRVYGLLGNETQKLNQELANYRKNVLHIRNLRALSFPITQLYGSLALCLIIVLASRMPIYSAAGLAGFLYLFTRYILTLANAMTHLTDSIYLSPNVARLIEVDQSRRQTGPVLSASARVVPGRLETVGWQFRDVDFGYSSDRLFLRGASFHVAPGSILSIEGDSGSGKSSLLALFLNELSPTRGEILLSTKHGTYPLSELRSQLLAECGYVGTETFFLAGTLRENLTYGLNFTPEAKEIEAVLDQAKCSFVSRLAGGLNHRLDEQAQGLSMGEKQRLSFARALLRKPSVLILDEATAHLDPRLERDLILSLNAFKGTTTVLVASHRILPGLASDRHVRLPICDFGVST
jgi:ABC-type multidrug transport system fused ATPase/permease subunit